MTADKAAETLGITPSRVRQLIREGLLPATRFGEKMWIISDDAVRDYDKRRNGARYGRIKR